MTTPSTSTTNRVDYVLKLIIIGDSGVGKTCLLKRFAKNLFDMNTKHTIGVEFLSKTVTLGNGQNVQADIWDTNGTERFQGSITHAYYRGAVGALLVYDTTSKRSFEHLQYWTEQLEKFADRKIRVMLVGNKTDLRKYSSVTKSEALDFSTQHNYSFIETSALDATNVEKCFRSLIGTVIQEMESSSRRLQEDRRRTKPQPIGASTAVGLEAGAAPAGASCCQLT